MINVTKTFLPPIENYQKQLERVWKNGWVTNNGELYQELTAKLKTYLGVNYVIPMTNGTLPLHIALKAYANKGEVITTPFSYVATTSAIVWENCTPIFVDIEPKYFTIDSSKIEKAITDKTTAILATHVYGNPCDIDAIDAIAKKHNLKVIYDAAHCFGVKYKGQSIFNYGDISTCSFHATKLFHTGEGGAVFCQNQDMYKEMFYRHNFGHDGQENYHGLGLNAKMNELQAAMGLCVLPYVDDIITKRKEICQYYDQKLDTLQFKRLKIRQNTDWNYAYYPIIFKSEEHLKNVKIRLEKQNVFARRYFYPSLEKLPYICSEDCKLSEEISKKVLCLPLYSEINHERLKVIVNILNLDLKNN